jgi:hypothetical protein
MDSPPPPMRPPGMHAPVYPHQPQLYDIEDPTSNDVLSGRGVTTNRHVGNENFRSLVNCNKVWCQIPFSFAYFSLCAEVAFWNVKLATSVNFIKVPSYDTKNCDESLNTIYSDIRFSLPASLTLLSSAHVPLGNLRDKHKETENEDFSFHCRSGTLVGSSW